MADRPWWMRIGTWVLGAALLLAVGLVLFGLALITFELSRRGDAGDEIQWMAWAQIYYVVLLQGLLPQLATTATFFELLVRFVPVVASTRLRTAAGLLLSSALGFPVVGLTFAAWTPTSAGDVVATWALLGGGASLALLITRRVRLGVGVAVPTEGVPG